MLTALFIPQQRVEDGQPSLQQHWHLVSCHTMVGVTTMKSAQRIDLVAVQGPSTTNVFAGALRLAIQPNLLSPGQNRLVQGSAEAKRPLADSGLAQPARSVLRACHGTVSVC